jgi:Kef-type K+ transport system membrane component KefB
VAPISFEHMFQNVAVLLLLSAAVGALALRLRQPLVVSFIAVGILVGPAGMGWMSQARELDFLAELGIALLLFVVGLKLDVALIRTMGKVAVATGMGQILFTSIIGYFLGRALGLEPMAALYVAVALTFSSTIIIVKLLTDKREIDALHGRIAVGFLIVQDLAVVLIMIGLTAFSGAVGEATVWTGLLQTLGVGVGLVLVLAVLVRWILPPLVHQMAHSHELLILFAIAWAVVGAATTDALGYSKEVGAFLAGVSLASTDYREAIGSRLVSVRDFLLLFFFLSLGAGLELSDIGPQLGAGMLLSVFVLVGNPLIVMIIMGVLGYRRRTGFLAGLTVAQISEFSLILAALGVSLGHIGRQTLGLVTLVGLITITLSTYLILYSHRVYGWLAPALRVFERKVPSGALQFEGVSPTPQVDVIVFGLGRFGGAIGRALREQGTRVVGVDFDPHSVSAARAEGWQALYGDAEDPEFPSHLPLSGVRSVVSTVPNVEVNVVLIGALRAHGYKGRILVAAHSQVDAERLTAAGADQVLMPFLEAAAGAVRAIVTG